MKYFPRGHRLHKPAPAQPDPNNNDAKPFSKIPTKLETKPDKKVSFSRTDKVRSIPREIKREIVPELTTAVKRELSHGNIRLTRARAAAKRIKVEVAYGVKKPVPEDVESRPKETKLPESPEKTSLESKADGEIEAKVTAALKKEKAEEDQKWRTLMQELPPKAKVDLTKENQSPDHDSKISQSLLSALSDLDEHSWPLRSKYDLKKLRKNTQSIDQDQAKILEIKKEICQLNQQIEVSKRKSQNQGQGQNKTQPQELKLKDEFFEKSHPDRKKKTSDSGQSTSTMNEAESTSEYQPKIRPNLTKIADTPERPKDQDPELEWREKGLHVLDIFASSSSVDVSDLEVAPAKPGRNEEEALSELSFDPMTPENFDKIEKMVTDIKKEARQKATDPRPQPKSSKPVPKPKPDTPMPPTKLTNNPKPVITQIKTEVKRSRKSSEPYHKPKSSFRPLKIFNKSLDDNETLKISLTSDGRRQPQISKQEKIEPYQNSYSRPLKTEKLPDGDLDTKSDPIQKIPVVEAVSREAPAQETEIKTSPEFSHQDLMKIKALNHKLALKANTKKLLETEKLTINQLIKSRHFELDTKNKRQEEIKGYNEWITALNTEEKETYETLDRIDKERTLLQEKRLTKFMLLTENLSKSEEQKRQIEHCYERMSYYEEQLKKLDDEIAGPSAK